MQLETGGKDFVILVWSNGLYSECSYDLIPTTN